MFEKILTKFFGSKHERDLKGIYPIVDQINALESSIKTLTDEQLKEKTAEFRKRLQDGGESLDDILPEAFAVCREASIRVLGMRHYDVQLIGGIIMHRGSIAEMRTGEGKTLVATLAVYLNALSGKGVHVVTVNDYLATRDCEWMGQLYGWLGLSTGTIVHDKSDRERKQAYGADITYGTNNEFGFDYLRDNMKFELEDYVQRPLNFAIVDECDSILIDEARTPLIISGPSDDSTDKYLVINGIIPKLQVDVHFTMEEKTKTVSLTEEGNAKVEELLGVDNVYDPQNLDLIHYVYQGLKAHYLFKKDVDYMVKNNEICIVDEFTGRLMEGRRWSDGLHQAIEAKEGVKVKSENQTLATITFQNYFRMYKKLSGMTGTAETEAVEFKKIYNLDVMVIPTNKPIARLDEDDVVYKTLKAKIKAIALDIQDRSQKGQPVLVGTVSIERSEWISNELKKLNIKHNVLNAKHHEREADIVAQAGRKSAITIATNMAGRGTDIVLGGNPEFLARAASGDDPEKFEERLKHFKELCAKEKQEVLVAGGLYIIGTERHESRRIDNQLRGRSGRQGDPGESRFYLSLEDDLMRKFNGERIQKIMTTLKVPDDEPIMAGMVSRAIEGAQRKVEGYNFDVRKNLLDYDDVMNQQRNGVYTWRREVLDGKTIEALVKDMMGEITSDLLDTFVGVDMKKERWDLDGLNTALAQQFGVSVNWGDRGALNIDAVTERVTQAVKARYEAQKNHLSQHFDEVARMLQLQMIDAKWKEHLANIDHLKEGINLRAYGQKDPLIEYKKEAFKQYDDMTYRIKAESVERLFKIQLVAPDEDTQQMYEQQRLRHEEQAMQELSGGGLGGSNSLLPYASEEMARLAEEQANRPSGGRSRTRGDEALNRAERRRQEKRNKKRKLR